MNNFMPIHLKTHKMETFLGQGGQTSEEVESLKSSMPIKEIGTVVQIFFTKITSDSVLKNMSFRCYTNSSRNIKKRNTP